MKMNTEATFTRSLATGPVLMAAKISVWKLVFQDFICRGWVFRMF